MRFKEAYEGYQSGRLTQGEAATLLGVCARSFRRYLNRYEDSGLDGLLDKRLIEVSHRRAPVDEVMALQALYRDRYDGWNVRHFHRWYGQEHDGIRSDTWVKNQLQALGLVPKGKVRGPHRKKRLPVAIEGMMIHQDGSTHQWVPEGYWALIVTMDDATNEHYSMRFVDEEGTHSRFLGVQDVMVQKGVFCSLYTDRGSHDWTTPQVGGKVDKANLTQFGAAMKRLGIEMIAAYSPEARGRSERAFGTHPGRLPNELALHGITDIDSANVYIKEHYLPQFNAEFSHESRESGSAFVPLAGVNLDDYLCEHYETTVTKDNGVKIENLELQIPADRHRHHYVKARVQIRRHLDQHLSIYHGPRCLGQYTPAGALIEKVKENRKTA